MVKNKQDQTFYEILRVSQTATLAEIKIAYKRRCMEYHPDVNLGANNSFCHEMMCKINEAYSVLKDAESRKAYDDLLKSRGQYSSSGVPTHEEQANQSDAQSEVASKTYKRQDYSEDIYEYYNSDDFDDDLEEAFIGWLEWFFDSYIKYVNNYYQTHLTSKNYEDLLERLYSLFDNIIIAEKSNIKKNNVKMK